MPRLSPDDPSSFSRPDEAVVKHFHWEIAVDFKEKVLRGHVDLDVNRVRPDVEFVVLDSSADLKIKEAICSDSGQKLELMQNRTNQMFGVCTRIRLPLGKQMAKIRVAYETSPSSAALLWVAKEDTVGKKHPYVYSQSEAIHARALLPCQDSPNVKSTFSATIQVPEGLTAVLSAIRTGQEKGPNGSNKFMFEQKIPIASYLLAFAVGDIECRRIGPRSHVWSEKEFVDKVVGDLEDTEKMLEAAEDILGPYIWGVYDVLVLPPSFPFTGMENPCLTFMTPTAMTGDKSVIESITHEICHSWIGNLVTSKNFEHFWLNEAFTVYIQRKITARFCGDDVRMFSAQDGFKLLKYCIDTMGHNNPFTKLVLGLENVSPDSSLSAVPYEKGHTLLYSLETLLGSDAMNSFFRAYVERFKFQSIETEQWKSFLYEFFDDKKHILDTVPWKEWLYTPGMPPVTPVYKSSLVVASKDLCRKWVDASDDELNSFTKGEFDRLNYRQQQQFFSELLAAPRIGRKKVVHLTELYEMTQLANVETRFRWLRVGLRERWEGIVEHVTSYLEAVGQLKYIVPLYRDLGSWPETRLCARNLYERLRPNMMYIARHAVDHLRLNT